VNVDDDSHIQKWTM